MWVTLTLKRTEDGAYEAALPCEGSRAYLTRALALDARRLEEARALFARCVAGSSRFEALMTCMTDIVPGEIRREVARRARDYTYALRLDIEAPELHALPWECVRLHDAGEQTWGANLSAVRLFRAPGERAQRRVDRKYALYFDEDLMDVAVAHEKARRVGADRMAPRTIWSEAGTIGKLRADLRTDMEQMGLLYIVAHGVNEEGNQHRKRVLTAEGGAAEVDLIRADDVADRRFFRTTPPVVLLDACSCGKRVDVTERDFVRAFMEGTTRVFAGHIADVEPERDGDRRLTGSRFLSELFDMLTQESAVPVVTCVRRAREGREGRDVRDYVTAVYVAQDVAVDETLDELLGIERREIAATDADAPRVRAPWERALWCATWGMAGAALALGAAYAMAALRGLHPLPYALFGGLGALVGVGAWWGARGRGEGR